MIHRKSIWVTVLGALLLLPQIARAGDGSKLLEVLPRGVQGVLVLDLEQARTSPLFPKLVQTAKKDPRVADLLKEAEKTTGLDPTRDLSTLVVASEPGKGFFLRGFVLLQGKFQQARVEKRLGQDTRLTTQTVLGHKVWAKSGHGSNFSVVFLRPDLIGFVHPSLLEGVMQLGLPPSKDPKAQPQPHGRAVDDASFKTLLDRPEHKGIAWFAGRIPAELRGNPEVGPLAQAEGLFGSAKLGGAGLSATITGQFIDETMPQQLSAALMLLKSRFARRQQVQELGLGPLLERLQAVPQGKEARVDFEMSGKELLDTADRAVELLSRSKQAKPAAAAGAAAPASAGKPAASPAPGGAPAASMPAASSAPASTAPAPAVHSAAGAGKATGAP